jgi:hypothetical protein
MIRYRDKNPTGRNRADPPIIRAANVRKKRATGRKRGRGGQADNEC